MNKQSVLTAIIVAVVFAGGGFWGGMMYASGQAPAARSASAGGAFAGRGGAGGAFAGRAGAGGAVLGTIVSADNGSITVQLAGQSATSTAAGTAATGSTLVLYGNSTQIEKTVSGSASDLSAGENIMIAGTTNSDGSMTASSIQIRPTSQGNTRAGQ